VRITFSDERAGYDLAEFFRRTECSAELVGQHSLEVNPRLPLLEEAATLEIEGLLRVWCKLHPEAEVAVSTMGRPKQQTLCADE
jgi:hypothetical protein